MTSALDFDTVARNAIQWLLAATDWADVSSRKRRGEQERTRLQAPSSTGFIKGPLISKFKTEEDSEEKFKSSLPSNPQGKCQSLSGEPYSDSKSQLLYSKSLDAKDHNATGEVDQRGSSDSDLLSVGVDGARCPRESASSGWTEEEEKSLDSDDYLSCDDCGCLWDGDCPEHGPLVVVKDTKVPLGAPDRARRTAPRQLAVLPSKIAGAGEGVWAREAIPRRTRFGPYEGRVTAASAESGYGWEVVRLGKTAYCVDASDETTSNWLRYVNCARNAGEENLRAFQHKGRVYYRTVRDVAPHSELLVWYGDAFAEELGIDAAAFGRPLSDPRVLVGNFPCEACKLCFVSPLLLDRHRRAGRCSEGLRRQACSHACSQACSPGDQDPAPAEPQPRRVGTLRLEGRPRRTHRCRVCGADFDCPSALARHSRTHTGERPFVCDTCGKRFNESVNLRNHERVHAGKKPFSCATFKQKNNLVRHERRVHTGEKPFSCATCGKGFNSSSSLCLHERVHTGEKPFSCATCGAAFAQKCNLVRHERVHTGEKPFSCATCGAVFAQKGNLVVHQRSHSGERPFSCDTCGAQFAQSCNLREHKLTHSAERPHYCAVCEASFRRPYNLRKHMKYHPVCEDCGVTCRNRFELREHRQTRHRGKLEREDCKSRRQLREHGQTHVGEFKCQLCGEVFSRPRQLHLHHRQAHPGEKPHKCKVCGKGFVCGSKLHLHERVHTGEKPFKCEVCGLAFSQSGNLSSHMSVHSSEKPFKCEVCGRHFREKMNMCRHMSLHSSEKSFKCDLCGKAFSLLAYLRKHEQVHRDEKPYKCDICSAAFRHGNTLRIHIRTHTGERPYQCNVCGAAFTQSGNLKSHLRIHAREKSYK